MPEFYKEEIKDIWLKAAVLGSLWASFEIIIGSFFHNIRLPLAGTILSLVAVALMVAFGQIWTERGLFWRAGLICALMKSVSPSAVLLGPMTGIFTEALILEVTLLLFGRNIIGYTLAGVAAVYSVVVHKVAKLLILYGFNIVQIFENFYYFILKQLKTEGLNFYQAFFILSSIYIILGIFAALSGYFIGKKVVKLRKNQEKSEKISLDYSKKFLQNSKQSQNYSVALLFAHLFFIVAGMSLVNYLPLWISAVFVFAYSLFTILYYKRALRYLIRPIVWLQVLFLTLISGIFYNGFESGNILKISGLLTGIEMSLRAILLMLGFSALSSELRNPVVKVILYQNGFRQLYKAIGLAFSALPYIIQNAPEPKTFIKKPFASIISNILIADSLLEKFSTGRKKREVIVISGKKHSGKTTYAKEVIENMQKRKISVTGFVAEGEFENGQRSAFFLKNLKTNQKQFFCGRKPIENGIKAGSFYIDKKGFDFGNKILNHSKIKKEEIIFIDEIGPFELKGKGWSAAIENIFQNTENMQVWIVREGLKHDVLKRFDITKATIFDIEKDEINKVANFITTLSRY